MAALSEHNLSVLVVDDKDPMRVILVQMLRAFGFKRIFAAADGRRAIELACEHRPDLVVTDWEMPDMSGLDLVRWVRRDPASPRRDLPVVIVTANDTMAQVLQARDAGVTSFLAKPVAASLLHKRVSAALNDARQFVDAKTFVGPCRRLKAAPRFTGPYRRFGDPRAGEVGFAR